LALLVTGQGPDKGFAIGIAHIHPGSSAKRIRAGGKSGDDKALRAGYEAARTAP